MSDILGTIESAFQLISKIPVTGDYVDAMAMARAKLRTVYNEIQKMESDETGKQSEND